MLSNTVKGNLFALMTFICMAFMGIFTKMASSAGGEIWVNFLLYASAAILATPLALRQGLAALKTHQLPKIYARALLGLGASYLYLLAIQRIPMVNATLLFNSAPIFIPILATVLLGVHFSKKTWFAIGLGFLGIVVIIKPTMAIFDHWGDLFGLASGLSLAGAYLLIKILSKTEPSERILFLFFSLATLTQVPLLCLAGPFPPMHEAICACLGGVSIVLAQVCLMRGYAYIGVSQAGIYQYTTIIFVALLDWLFYGFVPPLRDLLGVFLVILAGVTIIRESSTDPHPSDSRSSI